MKKAEAYISLLPVNVVPVNTWPEKRLVVIREKYLKYSDCIEAIKQAQKEAIEACAERVQLDTKNYFEATNEEQLKGVEVYLNSDDDRPSTLVVVDKQSILSLISELQ